MTVALNQKQSGAPWKASFAKPGSRIPRPISALFTPIVWLRKELKEGMCPNAASAMEMLADHYGIASINFALRVVELEQAGKLIYKSEEPAKDGVIRFSSDGVHPLDEGIRSMPMW